MKQREERERKPLLDREGEPHPDCTLECLGTRGTIQYTDKQFLGEKRREEGREKTEAY